MISRYDYGDKTRGNSFEYDTFVRYFEHQKTKVKVFDYIGKLATMGRKRMNEDLVKTAGELKPELVFVVPVGNIYGGRSHFEDGAMERLRKIAPTIAWMCDDKWRWESLGRVVCQQYSWVVTTDPEAVGKYKSIGYDRAILSQWAINPEDYRRNASRQKDIEVSFVGQINPWRKYVVERLSRQGIAVECYGNGWKNGRIGQKEMIEVFNRSKINLNLSNSVHNDWLFWLTLNWSELTNRQLSWPSRLLNFSPLLHSILHPKKKEDIKARFFEVTGCGGALLSYNVDYLGKYFKLGSEVVIYDSVDDLGRKIKTVLDNSSWKEVAKNGYLRVQRDHTYKQRFEKIFLKVGIRQ